MVTGTCLSVMRYLNAVDMAQRFLMRSKSFKKWLNCGLTWFDNLYPQGIVQAPYLCKDKVKTKCPEQKKEALRLPFYSW